MEAVYGWIQQIAVFVVISYLVLYLMGSQEKKRVLRFYLSLLMLFLVLRPVAGLMDLDTTLVQKLKELEIQENTEIAAVSGQIQEIGRTQDQEVLEQASQEAISWLQNLVQEENLEFLGGEVQFDEETLARTGEVIVCGVNLMVSQAEKTADQIRPYLNELKTNIAQAFELEESAVAVTAKE